MKISIEYCVVWNYTDRAVGLAAKLLADRPRAISELTLIPSGGGVFEVTVDGDLVFSKKATKRHPEYHEIEQALEGR